MSDSLMLLTHYLANRKEQLLTPESMLILSYSLRGLSPEEKEYRSFRLLNLMKSCSNEQEAREALEWEISTSEIPSNRAKLCIRLVRFGIEEEKARTILSFVNTDEKAAQYIEWLEKNQEKATLSHLYLLAMAIDEGKTINEVAERILSKK